MNQRKIGILLSYMNIVLHAVIGLAYVPILLHYIGKSEYGLYQLIGSLIAYFSIMDFGLTAAVVRYYTKYKVIGDQVKMENILAMAMRVYGVITMILLVLGGIGYILLPSAFGKSMTEAELDSAEKLFILLLFDVAVSISTMIFRSIINAHEKFLFLKGLELLQLVMQPVLVVLVLQEVPTALAVGIVQTALNIFLIIARGYYCFFRLHVTIRYHYFDRELFSGFKKLALSVFVVTLIDQVFFRTNHIILGIIDGTSAVAVYSLAAVIYMNYMLISTAVSGVYLPHITEMVAKREPIERFTELFIRIGRLQFLLLALVATGFIIFGQEFIGLWAGEGFQEAYVITLLIIIPFTVDLIQNIGLAIMQAMNCYDYRGKIYFVMGVFNLCLAVPMAKVYGGIGCAFVTGFTMLLGNGLIMNRYYLKRLGLDIWRFWKEIGSICLPVVVLTVIAYIMNSYRGHGGAVSMCISMVVYCVIYGAVVYRFSLNDEEKSIVNKLLRKIGISL